MRQNIPRAARRLSSWLAIASAALLIAATGSPCRAAPASGGAPAAAASEPRDGSHDFDFNLGVWQTQIRRYLHPLSGGAAEFVELSGTVSVRGLWGGRGQLEEIEADGPKGHWEGLTLFLYDPKTRQWTQSFANSAAGTMSSSLTGAYEDGRIELLSQDTLEGRFILVRGTWSEMTPMSHRYREEYSGDGGRTWAPAFDARLTRIATAAPAGSRSAPDPSPSDARSHAFDFDLGAWRTHSSRLLHPLTGSSEWAEMDGTTIVTPVWGGRANLAEYQADGAAGRVELIALRLYNPESRQWRIHFATPSAGTLGVPGVGEFRNGRADFYDQEEFAGRAILVRFSIWSLGADTARSEQAFSADGGKTWEVNWINEYSRLGAHAASAPPSGEGPRLGSKPAESAGAARGRDGSHDFDFELGEWSTHVRRLQHPLSGASTWLEYDGTTRVRGVLGDRANLAELTIAGPAGRIEGASLRLYDPEARQWSLHYVNIGDGQLTSPAVGSFRAGRGEFFGHDTWNGRPITVRFVIAKIDERTYRFEQAFSTDGGTSWEINWIATDVRRRG